MQFAPMLPLQTFQGLGEDWRGQRRPRAWDLNTPGGPQPLLLVQSPSPTKPLLDGRHLDSFLSQPVCLEMRDEKRDRGTERDRIRGQKWSDGGRKQGEEKAPEGPWSGAGCHCSGPERRSCTGLAPTQCPDGILTFWGPAPASLCPQVVLGVYLRAAVLAM